MACNWWRKITYSNSSCRHRYLWLDQWTTTTTGSPLGINAGIESHNTEVRLYSTCDISPFTHQRCPCLLQLEVSKHPTVPPFFLSLCHFKGLQTVTAHIIFDLMISIGLRTWGSPVHRAPCAVISLRLFRIPNTHKAILTYQARLNILVNVTATLCCYSIEVEGSHFEFLWVTSLLKVASEVSSST